MMKKRSRVRSGPSKDSKSTSFRCRNCQVRRVKCDGTIPACIKCTSTGRTCPGYSSWEVDLDLPEVLPPTPPAEQSDVATIEGQSSIARAPSLLIWNTQPPSDAARHAFDYFRHRICARYIERGYPILWATSSIAVGLQEPSVFYAMAALSTMERELTPIIHTSLARSIDKAKTDLAFKMYSQAISCLRQPLQKAIREDGPLEPIILCCILFLVLEVTAGNTLNAMRHARVGKRILDERLSLTEGSESTSVASSSSNSPLQTIRAMWTETSSNYQVPTPDPSARRLSFSQFFTSLEEVKTYLEVLVEAGQTIREELLLKAWELRRAAPYSPDDAVQFCLTHTFSRTMSIPVTTQERLNQIMNGFKSWQRGFRPMFVSDDVISQDLLMTQLRFFSASFALAMCRARYERLADSLADQYVRTVESAERLLRRRRPSPEWYTGESLQGPVALALMRNLSIVETGRPPDTDEGNSSAARLITAESSDAIHEYPASVFEFGVLHALFSIASRCRTSYMRRRAAQLLSRARRREAINSSRTLSAYAKAIIHIEEHQARRLTGQASDEYEFYADEVPEHARFLDVVARPICEQPFKFTLVCTQHIYGDGDEIELLRYECNDTTGDYRLTQRTRGPPT